MAVNIINGVGMREQPVQMEDLLGPEYLLKVAARLKRLKAERDGG